MLPNQVAVKLLEAAEGLQQGHSVRQTLEQRAAEAMERVAALEAMQARTYSFDAECKFIGYDY